MAEELVMPRLSDTMEEGTIGRWLKQEGDSIKEGDVLAEIETDKATMEFQAYADGTLLKILVGDGETVALGAPIALIGEQGEQVPDAPAAEVHARSRAEEPQAASAPAAEQAPQAPAANGKGAGGALRISPIARRMADRAGIDVSTLAGTGSGPDGRIVKADVERAIAAGGSAAPAAAATSRADRLRRSQRRGRAARSDADAEGNRPPHVGVEDHRPPLLPLGRDRHDPGRPDAGGAERGAGRRRREDQHQRPDRAGLRDGADRASPGAPLVRGRPPRLPPARQHRHRGGARRRPDRAGAARRRHPQPARDRGGRTRPGHPCPRRRPQAERDRGRHVHRSPTWA